MLCARWGGGCLGCTCLDGQPCGICICRHVVHMIRVHGLRVLLSHLMRVPLKADSPEEWFPKKGVSQAVCLPWRLLFALSSLWALPASLLVHLSIMPTRKTCKVCCDTRIPCATHGRHAWAKSPEVPKRGPGRCAACLAHVHAPAAELLCWDNSPEGAPTACRTLGAGRSPKVLHRALDLTSDFHPVLPNQPHRLAASHS